jgi:hypothetical protein
LTAVCTSAPRPCCAFLPVKVMIDCKKTLPSVRIQGSLQAALNSYRVPNHICKGLENSFSTS